MKVQKKNILSDMKFKSDKKEILYNYLTRVSATLSVTSTDHIASDPASVLSIALLWTYDWH